MGEVQYPEADHGWSSSFPEFREAPAPYVRQALIDFLKDISPEQLRAWDSSIPPLQKEVGEVLEHEPGADQYSAILEYQLPMEQRRPDVVLLIGGAVLVLEFKSKSRAEPADLDQASAYARDLHAYHRDCDGRPILAGLVLMGTTGRLGMSAGVEVLGPDAIDDFTMEIDASARSTPLTRRRFLDPDAYRPLPTIVEAARELMESGELRHINRAAAATAPTLDYLTTVAHEAARDGSRHLVLVSGLPGTGKTLVGLQLAHARFLDDLAVRRGLDMPTAPAVYLSGNGPLVEVLQYELRAGGGGGQTFVRDVKAYVARYAKRPELVPPEHVLIFDEAQRAHDAKQVAAVHKTAEERSEPEHFVRFAERIPGWCVVVGLLGSGQEIHVGEEAGIQQWRQAILGAAEPDSWSVHVAPETAGSLQGVPRLNLDDRLHLRVELRYHAANEVHELVDGMLLGRSLSDLQRIAQSLQASRYPLRVTRDLDSARTYLRQRYADDPDARFGIVASSRDRDLIRFGIPNDWNATKRLRFGPWFVEGDDDPLGRSCRALRDCVTEFGCQGLELDAVLMAWGTDLVRANGQWDSSRMRPYQNATRIRDAFQLRLNAYRVLLTRARDGLLVFIPPIRVLDETFGYLREIGFGDVEAGG